MGFRHATYACAPLAAIVIIANSLAPPNIEIITTFSKALNAMVLIIGGYILQKALIGTSLYELTRARRGIEKTS